MRCDWRNDQEEWLISSQSILQKSQSLFGDDIGSMVALITHRRLAVSLIGRIEVGISEWIQQKIGSVESIDVWFIVVVYSMGIEQLSRVECVIA